VVSQARKYVTQIGDLTIGRWPTRNDCGVRGRQEFRSPIPWNHTARHVELVIMLLSDDRGQWPTIILSIIGLNARLQAERSEFVFLGENSLTKVVHESEAVGVGCWCARSSCLSNQGVVKLKA